MKNRLTRWILVFQIYALDLEIERMNQMLQNILPAETRRLLELSRSIARKNRTTLRSRYTATCPVGQRRTWKTA